jgi:pimeloyl-ACP methyl ester carboxylesterase
MVCIHGVTDTWRTWLPNAGWVVPEGIGHCPQLEVPLEAAELILGFSED